MKVGDIFFNQSVKEREFPFFARIQKIDYTIKKRKIKIGGTFFKPEYKEIEEQEMDNVWYVKLGDNTGIMYSPVVSSLYDWDKMILEAKYLLNQIKNI